MSAPRVKPISAAEPVTDLRRIPIRENGEPLVDFVEACPLVRLGRGRFDYRREKLLRLSAANMLRAASEAMPKGNRLAVVEGWRPPHIQRRMYTTVWERFKERNPDWSDVRLRRTVNQFTAPMDARVPPPHTTGGALDVFLVDEDDNELEMSNPFKPIDTKAFSAFAPGLTEASKRHRQIMREALLAGGLTNYPSEYWHWSYGDQGWAYRGGHPAALYGPIEPLGWTPDPAEATDEPLTFKED